MNDKQRNRAFAKERNARLNTHILLQQDTAKEITALLAEARRRVEMQLAILPSDYQKWYLPQIKAEINAALREFNQLAGNVLNLGADNAWSNGVAMVDAPAAAAGVIISQALPQIDRRQLLAMKHFMTGRIVDISTEVANKINSELAQVMIGIQSPGEAVGKVAGMVDGGRGRAITIVRTELGRAFSIASQQRMDQAAEYLPGLQKKWRRSGKLHSRIDHDIADGQIRASNKAFDVGGEKLMHPRDPSGSAKNTINCGCVSISFMAHWKVKNPGRLQFTDEELRLSSQKSDLQAKINRGEVI